MSIRPMGPSQAGLAGAYVTRSSVPGVPTYNADGTVATFTESDTGAVVTYAYTNGNPTTETRVLSGVTTVRTLTWNADGSLASVA